MNGLSTLWGREPAMVIALIGAILALLISFGFHVTDEQTGAIIAVAQIVLGLITRSRVTPA